MPGWCDQWSIDTEAAVWILKDGGASIENMFKICWYQSQRRNEPIANLVTVMTIQEKEDIHFL